jgi:hypothetical protein
VLLGIGRYASVIDRLHFAVVAPDLDFEREQFGIIAFGCGERRHDGKGRRAAARAPRKRRRDVGGSRGKWPSGMARRR